LNQLNIVSSDPAAAIAFYRRLGVEIPDGSVWCTATGIHHASARADASAAPIELEIDSTAFAQLWNSGWAGRFDLRGRVVVGFRLPSREAVDALYADLIGAGHAGLQPPCDAFWGSRYAIIADPDGVAVGLMSPPAADGRSPPPAV
jgi:uncharacterized glyoxalase superfamily protein PhnB